MIVRFLDIGGIVDHHYLSFGIRVALSLVFYVVFCRSLFVLLPFFLLAIVLSVLSHLRLLITSLVYSNLSFLMTKCYYLN